MRWLLEPVARRPPRLAPAVIEVGFVLHVPWRRRRAATGRHRRLLATPSPTTRALRSAPKQSDADPISERGGEAAAAAAKCSGRGRPPRPRPSRRPPAGQAPLSPSQVVQTTTGLPTAGTAASIPLTDVPPPASVRSGSTQRDLEGVLGTNPAPRRTAALRRWLCRRRHWHRRQQAESLSARLEASRLPPPRRSPQRTHQQRRRWRPRRASRWRRWRADWKPTASV